MSVYPGVSEDEYLALIITNNFILPSKGPWAIHCELATHGGGPLHKLVT